MFTWPFQGCCRTWPLTSRSRSKRSFKFFFFKSSRMSYTSLRNVPKLCLKAFWRFKLSHSRPQFAICNANGSISSYLFFLSNPFFDSHLLLQFSTDRFRLSGSLRDRSREVCYYFSQGSVTRISRDPGRKAENSRIRISANTAPRVSESLLDSSSCSGQQKVSEERIFKSRSFME